LRRGSGTAGDGEQPSAPARGLPHDSLAEFLDCDYRRLVAGLALVAGSRAAAEDAVQEALARAWERGLRGEQITSLSGFVAVVATNLLRSRFRRLLVEQRARQRLGEGLHRRPTQPEAHLGAADLRVDLARALQALPRRQREAVVLHYFADLSIQDIALALDTRPDTAKGLLHRGRRSLLRVLGPDYQERVDHAG
jgi:RNA polymerase sigma-70 factor (ECF subfamily)